MMEKFQTIDFYQSQTADSMMEDPEVSSFDYKFKIIDYKPCDPRNFIESYYGPTLQKYLVGWSPDD